MKERSSGTPQAVVVGLALALYGPGLFVAGYDGEEGRRVLMALGMLRDGHWVVPHIAGEPYLTKPPLYPWSVAGLGTLVGGVTPALARLPSLLATVAIAFEGAAAERCLVQPGRKPERELSFRIRSAKLFCVLPRNCR